MCSESGHSVLKDCAAASLAHCPVLLNLTTLSTLTWRLLCSYRWDHLFAWFFQTWELFTFLFWRMQKSHYPNWKGSEIKQNNVPWIWKVLSNPADGCAAIVSLCFLFQWSTLLIKRASLHGVQAIFIACWLCGNFLKSRNNTCGSLTRAISTLEYVTVYYIIHKQTYKCDVYSNGKRKKADELLHVLHAHLAEKGCFSLCYEYYKD